MAACPARYCASISAAIDNCPADTRRSSDSYQSGTLWAPITVVEYFWYCGTQCSSAAGQPIRKLGTEIARWNRTRLVVCVCRYAASGAGDEECESRAHADLLIFRTGWPPTICA